MISFPPSPARSKEAFYSTEYEITYTLSVLETGPDGTGMFDLQRDGKREIDVATTWDVTVRLRFSPGETDRNRRPVRSRDDPIRGAVINPRRYYRQIFVLMGSIECVCPCSAQERGHGRSGLRKYTGGSGGPELAPRCASARPTSVS